MDSQLQNELIPRNWGSEVWEASIAELASMQPTSAAASMPIVLIVDDAVNDDWERPRLHRDFMSLYIARQGRGTHVIDGVPFEVVRGDVYTMRPGMAHQFVAPDNLILDTVHFSPSIFEDRVSEALAVTPGFTSLFFDEPMSRGDAGRTAKWLHLSPAGYSTAADMYAELRREWAAGTPSGTILTIGLLLRLLVFLSREYGGGLTAPSVTDPTQSSHAATVAMAVRYIDEHFAESVRVDELATSFFLSPGRFTEVFRTIMGCAPRDYITHVRMEHAKTLLAGSTMTVTSIAGLCGYPDPAHFTRQFRDRVGKSPRQFRG